MNRMEAGPLHGNNFVKEDFRVSTTRCEDSDYKDIRRAFHKSNHSVVLFIILLLWCTRVQSDSKFLVRG